MPESENSGSTARTTATKICWSIIWRQAKKSACYSCRCTIGSNPLAAMIDARLGAFVDTIWGTHPKTPLIFMQTLVRQKGNFDTRAGRFEQDKREAAERLLRERMKSNPNRYLINPADLIDTDHNATADGIHPTDLGFDRMRKHIEQQILKILDKYGIR